MTCSHRKGRTRRQFLAICGLSLPALNILTCRGDEGKKLTVAAAFDHEIEAFMRDRNVPGGALAVVKDGRLVYARGYGWADSESRTSVKADSLFRIASVSKPITAVAVLKLVQEGRVKVEARALDLVDSQPFLETGKKADERLKTITVRHLLQHTGGWDRDQSFDPMFHARK